VGVRECSRDLIFSTYVAHRCQNLPMRLPCAKIFGESSREPLEPSIPLGQARVYMTLLSHPFPVCLFKRSKCFPSYSLLGHPVGRGRCLASSRVSARLCLGSSHPPLRAIADRRKRNEHGLDSLPPRSCGSKGGPLASAFGFSIGWKCDKMLLFV